jgi:circadian clock protein KaiC
MHLVAIHKALQTFDPQLVVLDPISSLLNAGTLLDTRSILTRLIDHLKAKGVTAVFTSLTGPEPGAGASEVTISSLIDTWLQLEVVHAGAERTRLLTVVKSRGMAHTAEAVEFRLTRAGVELSLPGGWDGARAAAREST